MKVQAICLGSGAGPQLQHLVEFRGLCLVCRQPVTSRLSVERAQHLVDLHLVERELLPDPRGVGEMVCSVTGKIF